MTTGLVVRCKRCGDPAVMTPKSPNAAGYTCGACQQIVAQRKR